MDNYINVTSPYNFVPFCKDKDIVKVNEEQLRVHNIISEELLTGEIKYKIKAETPIFISNGHKDENGQLDADFFKNEKGKYAIPGSSIRGMIRSNAQVLGLSGMWDDVDDYNLMYRNVSGKGKVAEEYKENLVVKTILNENGGTVSVLRDVEAGFIKNEGNKYVLYGSEGKSIYGDKIKMNYYIISERHIVDKYIECKKDNKVFPYPIFIKDGKSIMQHTFNKKFKIQIKNIKECENNKIKDIGELQRNAKKIKYKITEGRRNNKYIEETDDGDDGFYMIKKTQNGGTNVLLYDKDGKCLYQNGRIHYIGEKNQRRNQCTNRYESIYKPYEIRCLYKIDKYKHVCEIIPYSDNKEGYLEGYVVSTGTMNEKKSIYVIPKKSESDIIKEFDANKDKTIKSFIIDFNKKKNILGSFGGEKHFSLPKKGEERPIFFIKMDDGRFYLGFTPRLRLFYKNSIKKGMKQENNKFDYAKSIFGTIDDEKKIGYKSKVSFTDVIALKDYNVMEEKSIVLSEPKPTSYLDYLNQNNGIVSYNSDEFALRGMKQYWLHDNIITENINSNNTNMNSKIRPLDKGTEYKGTIRFHSMTKEELGLLLWSLKLEEGSWQNIGMAKPYGFGAVSVSDINVRVIDNKKAYGVNILNLNPFVNMDDIEVDELITNYKDSIGEDIMNVESVSTLLNMKNPKMKPQNREVEYMDLKTYTKRVKNNIPLKTVDEIIKKSN